MTELVEGGFMFESAAQARVSLQPRFLLEIPVHR